MPLSVGGAAEGDGALAMGLLVATVTVTTSASAISVGLWGREQHTLSRGPSARRLMSASDER
jgi:hypothetical protein